MSHSTPSNPDSWDLPPLGESVSTGWDEDSTLQTTAHVDIPPPSKPARDAADGVGDSWAELEKQQGEFDRHSRMLDILRNRLEKYLERQNEAIHRREKSQSKDRTEAKPAEPAEEQTPAALTIYEDDLVSVDRPAEASQAVIEIYRERIHKLEREKNAAQSRLKALKSLDPDQHPAIALVASRKSDWRFSIALVASLLLGGVLIVTTRFHFQVASSITVDPDKLTSAEAQAYAEQLHRFLRADTAGRPDGLSAGPNIHYDKAHNRLWVQAVATDTDGVTNWLNTTLAAYVAQAEDERQTQLAAARRELADLDQELFSLSNRQDQLHDELSSHRQTIESEHPREQFEALQEQLRPARDEYDQVQAEILDVERQLYTLDRTTIPEQPEVDSKTRLNAESADQYLQEDLEALRARLNQVRDHLLDGFSVSAEPIQDFYAAANSLRLFLDQQKLNLDDPQISRHLDQLITRSNDLLQVLSDFEKNWRNQQDNLQRLTVDPRRRDCLQIQRELEELIKDFKYETNIFLKDLQTAYQELTHSIQDHPAYFELRNGLAHENVALAKQQMAFSRFAQRFLSQEDFQLEAIMHSAVGLSRRIQDRQQLIENQLSAAKHQELTAAHDANLNRAQQQLEQLTTRREELIGNMLQLHDGVSALVPSLERFSAVEVQFKYEQVNAEKLKEQLEHRLLAKQQLEGRIDLLDRRQTALQVGTVQAATWPVNLLDRLSQVGFGLLASLIGVYVLLVFVTQRHSRSKGPTTSTS